MTIDWTLPIQTRDGRKARLLGVIKNRQGQTHLVAADLTEDIDEDLVYSVFPSGHCELSYSAVPDDIINAPPPPKYVWVNVYEELGFTDMFAFDSLSDAESAACPNDPSFIARLKIDLNEVRGRFDE